MSIKLIRAGHPWVTNDKFSEKFHPKERFIIAANRKKPFALLIHDPTHKHVRARVWATSGHFQKLMKNFKNDVITRLRKSFQNRKAKNYFENRNHFYLAFGENDQLPGIFIKYMGGEILIEFYMEFWRTYQDFVIQNVVRSFNEVFDRDLTISNIWIQYRDHNKESAKCLDPISTFRRVDINEYGVNYKVYLGKHYDTGIYTDMAAIRSRLKKQLSNCNSLLNLYSYTGAFSLYAASLGVEDITSVDMSEAYQEWLQDNIALNEDLDLSGHTSLTMTTLEALEQLKEEGKKFECIISDPPSSSNDGNRTTNALSEYTHILPLMYDVMEENGTIIAFLNTHKIGIDKFKNKLKNIIHKNKLPLVLSGNLYLGEDCPYKKGFPEGSYLKGIILKKKRQRPEDESENKKTPAPKEKQVKAEVKEETSPKEKSDHQETQTNTEKSAKKVTKKVAKKAAKKTAKKVTKKATKKVAKKTAKKTAKKVTKKATKKTAKKATKKTSKKESES
tara:strand:+ start:21664 stop:23175 length:1512 start_codon:yes stop_codon:yes gene_type:complete